MAVTTRVIVIPITSKINRNGESIDSTITATKDVIGTVYQYISSCP
jgi:hypothetical protein